jgi:hypothetical protein
MFFTPDEIASGMPQVKGASRWHALVTILAKSGQVAARHPDLADRSAPRIPTNRARPRVASRPAVERTPAKCSDRRVR